MYVKVAKTTNYMILACIPAYLVCGLIPWGGWGGLLGRSAVCIIVPNLIFMAAFHRKEEFRNWIGILKGIIG